MSDTDFIVNPSEWRKAIQTVKNTVEVLLERERKRSMPVRILIIDDDANDVCFLCRDLRGFNCEVEVCHDSEEAEKVLSTKKFDFAFLDQKMPKVTGLELLKKMPAEHSTRFFMFSGFHDSKVAGEALKLGALFLPKPMTESERDGFKRVLSIFLRQK